MKAEKPTRKHYDESFKRDAVALVTEQGHQVTDAARRLGINPNLIHRWKQEFEQEKVEHKANLEKLVTKGKCEEAKAFVESLDKQLRPSYSHTNCIQETRVRQLQSSNDPQIIYVNAARLESEDDRATAERLYKFILDTFPSSPIAVKAADRITAIADVRAMVRSNQSREEAVRDANREATREAERRSAVMRDSIDRTNRDAGNRAYNQCKIEVDTCYSQKGTNCYRNCDSLR